MPKSFSTIHVLPLKVLCKQLVLSCRAKEQDFEYIKSSSINDKVPDYNGFNTQRTRDSDQSLKPKSKVVFTPVLERTLSDPSTMLTTMTEAARITHETGQSVTVFTADQKLYRVALVILWTYETRFTNFVPRIGGLHWVMSFVGCISVLMRNIGLLSWLNSAFGRAEKMLTGKKFPMNVRSLSFAMLELLRDYVRKMKSFQDLAHFLNACSSNSMLSKHWVDNVIRPVMFIMMYVRDEREGDFTLHLHAACCKMMPYFFAAGYVNYARYGLCLCYLRKMHKLPGIVLKAVS